MLALALAQVHTRLRGNVPLQHLRCVVEHSVKPGKVSLALMSTMT